jgi:uncharacterized protein YidB (DUF937 family)/outer membrane protein OmpA-like peptidoglycan-associated protein
MFDLIIREAASRFGLGDKAGPLVQMLLAFITNKDTGGIGGFMSKLSAGGLGNIAQSWLGGGAGAQAVSSSQIESLLGGQGGLLNSVTSKLGIGGATASSALGFILPAVIGKLTPGGSVPTSLSSDVMGFISGGASSLTKGATGAAMGAVGAAGAAAGAASVAASKVVGSAGNAVSGVANAGVNAASSAGGGLMKWLPWLAVGIAALFALSYCSKGGDAIKQATDGAKSAAASAASATTAVTDAAAKATADAAAAAKALADKAAADAEAAAKATADAAKAAADAALKAAPVAEAPAPVGSGIVTYMAGGAPALKVYFDSGKVAVASEFGAKSKEVVEYLKANASAKAVVSGFNDPTGNAAANAELSKNRAKNVVAALKAAGFAEDRVVSEKPADPTAGAAKSNAEARRVEVTIRK